MILIIKNGYCDTQIMKYLDEDSKVISSFNLREIEYYKEHNDLYSLVIVLGGPQSAKEIEQHDNLINLVKFITFCIEINKPILGICLGAQVISRIFNCEIKTLNELKCSYINISDFDNIFRCHQEYIIPNDMIEVIDYFDFMPYIFKIKGKNIYGLQCHPDIEPNLVLNFTNDNDILSFVSNNSDMINENNKKLIQYILDKLRLKYGLDN